MGIFVSRETSTGYAVVAVGTPHGADLVRTEELSDALAECARLARELAQIDPVKASKCDVASKNEKLTAHELFGLVKGDDLRR